MGIGGILSDLIQQRGTNVNKLAQATSIPPQTLYSMIRRDSMKVDIEVLIRVCRELDVPVEYVYDKYKGAEVVNNDGYSEREISLIQMYRELDDDGQEVVDSLVEKLREQQLRKLNR